ncbi:hypothetical protein CVT26_006051 [Gymnopilus dilepis]|uniref:Uncharacterized protein n=1 Tax=Gymnopilus dilepis TaxID=231916 RepID=A0A409Y1D6_9AGAR|nr:hypothetical protein CVT26_006051 [Gymnopilus dilepis]
MCGSCDCVPPKPDINNSSLMYTGKARRQLDEELKAAGIEWKALVKELQDLWSDRQFLDLDNFGLWLVQTPTQLQPRQFMLTREGRPGSNDPPRIIHVAEADSPIKEKICPWRWRADGTPIEYIVTRNCIPPPSANFFERFQAIMKRREEACITLLGVGFDFTRSRSGADEVNVRRSHEDSVLPGAWAIRPESRPEDGIGFWWRMNNTKVNGQIIEDATDVTQCNCCHVSGEHCSTGYLSNATDLLGLIPF